MHQVSPAGDFWDERGALPVEPLNAVLSEMRNWTCPVLMLVGNHDQVDYAGMTHALTPIAAACPNVHVFDAPAYFNGALWLPYRRNNEALTAALQAVVTAAGPDGTAPSSMQEVPSGKPMVHAIFAHADIVRHTPGVLEYYYAWLIQYSAEGTGPKPAVHV